MEELLEVVEVLTAEQPSASVIWLHGLGADGHDFVPIVPELGLDPQLAVRFVFPHASRRPVTINMGMVMRAWYDVSGLDNLDRGQDEQGIRESATQIERLIERENERGIPSERIVIAGFSQGGAIAYHVGLRHRRSLAGILVLSAYLPLQDKLTNEQSDANRGMAS